MKSIDGTDTWNLVLFCELGYSFAKNSLFKERCVSLYDCELWTIYVKVISNLFIAIRRSLHRVWNLSYNANGHLAILNFDTHSTFNEIFHWNMHFLNWCISLSLSISFHPLVHTVPLKGQWPDSCFQKNFVDQWVKQLLMHKLGFMGLHLVQTKHCCGTKIQGKSLPNLAGEVNFPKFSSIWDCMAS